MSVTDRKPRGLLRLALRAPIWLYRVGLGRLAGHRLLYLAHQGRRTGARREVVVEIVRFDPAAPEAVVIAAWGKNPDWYRNLRANPAIEVRIGADRWLSPHDRLLDGPEVLRVLEDYRRAHPRAWRRLAPLLGFPVSLTDPRWPDIAGTVRAVAFTPADPS